MLTDDDMRALRTAADMQGLSAEFAVLEARALSAPAAPEPMCDLLRTAHSQIKHLIDDLTVATEDDGLTRYVPRPNLMFSNLIGALVDLAPRMQAAIDAATAALSVPNPWRDAIDEALTAAGLDCAAPETSPAEAVAALLRWHQQIALDPAVSSDAQALIERGRAEAAPSVPAVVSQRLTTAPSVPEGWPSVDEFAQHIRWLNGGNKMGACALAEKLLEWLQSRAAPQPGAHGAGGPNVAGNRLAEGKSGLTGLLGGPTRSEKE